MAVFVFKLTEVGHGRGYYGGSIYVSVTVRIQGYSVRNTV
jgi:hypothetical protein